MYRERGNEFELFDSKCTFSSDSRSNRYRWSYILEVTANWSDMKLRLFLGGMKIQIQLFVLK